MSEPISWQPKPITKCSECPHQCLGLNMDYACDLERYPKGLETWRENHKSLTISCPAWQAQQKEKTE